MDAAASVPPVVPTEPALSILTRTDPRALYTEQSEERRLRLLMIAWVVPLFGTLIFFGALIALALATVPTSSSGDLSSFLGLDHGLAVIVALGAVGGAAANILFSLGFRRMSLAESDLLTPSGLVLVGAIGNPVGGSGRWSSCRESGPSRTA